MTYTHKFIAQRVAFEAAYRSGDWESLRPHFTEDVVYEVMNIQFHCKIQGFDRFITGMDRATSRFDKLCKRQISRDAYIREENSTVLAHTSIRFSRGASPVLETSLWEISTYRDGRIDRMIDLYNPEDAEKFEQWMLNWGDGLDARYVVPE